MYRTYGLLLPESDFSMDAAARKLKISFPTFGVELQGDTISVARQDWDMQLRLEAGPEVLEESLRISEHIGGAEDELGISRCSRRVVAWSDSPDPVMEHFDDAMRMTEVLRTFKGVIAVDPQEPSLL